MNVASDANILEVFVSDVVGICVIFRPDCIDALNEYFIVQVNLIDSIVTRRQVLQIKVPGLLDQPLSKASLHIFTDNLLIFLSDTCENLLDH